MPAYQDPPYTPPFTPALLVPSRPLVVWNAEAIAVGGKSAQFCMLRHNLPSVLSVEVRFSADPGDFQVDLQTADTDLDSSYVTKANIATTALNASFVGRIEATDVVAKFARLVLVASANAVNVTGTIF